MKTMDNVHLIGIGGSGMSAIARIFHGMGTTVTGSDSTDSPVIESLRELGIKIFIGHDGSNINFDTGLVIYSQAIEEDNEELLQAEEGEIRMMSYPQALGLLTQNKETVAVCGTHGKTTTTGMIASALIDSGKDPSVVVGADLHELGNKNAILGKSNLMIIEACEYKRAFLNFAPNYIVLTNLEPDHFDFYKTYEDYLDAFRHFIGLLPPDGKLIVNIDNDSVRELIDSLRAVNTITFGKSSNADYSFDKIAKLNLSIPGDHNMMNALAAYALCGEFNVNEADVKKSLESFKGAARRFELKGKIGKTEIYDDYAHHPTAIKATLKAAREKFGPDAKILCVFQPHQYSRTYNLLEEFSESFSDADEVIISNIYGVRDSEEDMEKVDVETLVNKISEHHDNASHGEGLENTARIVKEKINDYDFIFTMGAGDVWQIYEDLK
ncbi:UDP-N-acetylmuramate--L-alanine ligase [Pseudomonadota bacterium]